MAYRDAIGRFVGLARGLLHRVASLAGLEPMALGLEADDDGEVFSPKRGFYFTDLLQRHAPPAPWIWLLDGIAPRPMQRKRASIAAERYVVDLLRVNAARVRGDLDDRLRDSAHRLEVHLRVVLHEGRRAAIEALERARSARARGQAAVEQELSIIDGRLAKLHVVPSSRSPKVAPSA